MGGNRPGDPRGQTPLPAAIHARQPWLRLQRREVDALVREKHRSNYLRDSQARAEHTRINRELKRLIGRIAALEERKSKIAGSRN